MKLFRAGFAVLFTIIFSSIVYSQTLGTSTPIPEGTCNAGVATTDILCADALTHALVINNNNAGAQNIPQNFYVPTTYTNATTTFSNITGLVWPVVNGRNYHAICKITWQGSATTAGPKYQFVGPTGFTAIAASMLSVTSAAVFQTKSVTTYSSALANTTTVDATTNFTDILDFTLLNAGTTASGVVNLMAAANGVGTLTIQPGSACIVQ